MLEIPASFPLSMSERWHRHEREREGWTFYHFSHGGLGRVGEFASFRRMDCSQCGFMVGIEMVYVAFVVFINLATWRRSYEPRYYDHAFDLDTHGGSTVPTELSFCLYSILVFGPSPLTFCFLRSFTKPMATNRKHATW